jgi:hypothetical protein
MNMKIYKLETRNIEERPKNYENFAVAHGRLYGTY